MSYIADGARTLNDQMATRFPDDEDYYVSNMVIIRLTEQVDNLFHYMILIIELCNMD